MLLTEIVQIKGIIHCVTGLRIGGSSDIIEIGGMDNPIVRHPITELPYIPGSSLKGKMRSLLESVYGRKAKDGSTNFSFRDKDNPCMCGKCIICKVFGAHKNLNHKQGPTRIIFRDADLTDDYVTILKEAREEKGINFSDIKMENSIKRTSGTAHNPRPYERVPAGAEFNMDITLKIYDRDNKEELINLVKQGFQLLEADYLGSSGSRGYGKIEFRNLQFIEKDVMEKIKVNNTAE